MSDSLTIELRPVEVVVVNPAPIIVDVSPGPLLAVAIEQPAPIVVNITPPGSGGARNSYFPGGW